MLSVGLMSHVRVWEQLAIDPDPAKYYIMMEDDAYPMPDFELRLHSILQELQQLPNGWDWVYLSIHPRYRVQPDTRASTRVENTHFRALETAIRGDAVVECKLAFTSCAHICDACVRIINVE